MSNFLVASFWPSQRHRSGLPCSPNANSLCGQVCRFAKEGQKSWRYDFTIPKGPRVRFILGMSPPPDVERLSHADLKDLVLRLLEEVAELRRTVAAQRDEIARLKGGSGRPNIKPSGMDSATEPKQSPTAGGEPRQKESKTSKLSIHEERTVELEAPPQGARFKGYTDAETKLVSESLKVKSLTKT